MERLNAAQMSVVSEDPSASMQIIATAGSGKTRCLVARIVRLLECGHAPDSIMLVTFTRNSAEDMRRRLETFAGTEIADAVLCGTFHSLAYRLLPADMTRGAGSFDVHRDEVLGKFAHFLRNTDPSVVSTATPAVAAIRHVFVDESQDMDSLQHGICRSLVAVCSATLTLVGDDSQNIYGFRGSDSSFLREHGKNEGVLSKMLNINYRSTARIVRFANASIANSFSSIPKRMIPGYGGDEKDEHPVRVVRVGRQQEIRFVAEEVVKLDDEFARGKTFRNVAVLCRTNGTARLLETILTIKGRCPRVITSPDDDDEPARPRGVTADSSPRIVLATIHGSKGLEFDAVIVPGVSEGGFPRRSDSEEEIEQERRLFIVAITRARQRLMLTYSGESSRFVSEIANSEYAFEDTTAGAIDRPRRVQADTAPADPADDPDLPSRTVGVTSIVDRMTGEDYARLRKIGILPDVRAATVETAHEGFKFPPWVSAAGCYAEFGSFVDLLARFRIAAVAGMPFSDECANRCFLAYATPQGFRGKENAVFRAAEDLLSGSHDDMVRLDRRLASTARDVVSLCGSFGLGPSSVFLHGKGEAPAFKSIAHAADDISVMRDLYLVSSCRFLHKYPPRLANIFKQPTRKQLIGCADFLDCTSARAKEMAAAAAADIATDVTISVDGMHGVADVVVGNTVEEIKCSLSDAKIEWILQLLAYAHMLRRAGRRVDNVRIYNALKGTVWTLDIQEWKQGGDLFNFLANI